MRSLLAAVARGLGSRSIAESDDHRLAYRRHRSECETNKHFRRTQTRPRYEVEHTSGTRGIDRLRECWPSENMALYCYTGDHR